MRNFFLLFLLNVSIQLSATVYYLDPISGNMSNTGGSTDPWTTLADVITNNKIESLKWDSHPVDTASVLIPKNSGAPVKPGDTLMLRNGYHGAVTITEYYNTSAITIMPQPGHQPLLSQLVMNSCKNWKVYNLTIAADADTNNVNEGGVLIKVESPGWTGPSSNISIDTCYMYSIQNSLGWTKEQWDTLSCTGVWLRADTLSITRNYLKNVNFGISVSGNQSVIKNNVVENFAGDGLRGLGNDLLFEYNIIKNCYKVNANHDDGFQSWSINSDPPRERITLRGNTFISFEDSLQPFRGTLQAIGCFDGWFIDWIIENNVIITDHWHGISLYGAKNCRIVNNTVIDRNPYASPGPPWIQIAKHPPDQLPSTNNIVRNNIATDYKLDTTGGTNQYDHNLEITTADYAFLFVDHNNFDLHLNAGCIAIDSGIATMAPSIDRDGIARPFGPAHDLGAYEYWYSTVDVKEESIENSILIYPNPSSGDLFVDAKFLSREAVIEIINIQGVVLYQQQLNTMNLQRLHLADLASGLYFVRILQGSELLYADRWIKQE